MTRELSYVNVHYVQEGKPRILIVDDEPAIRKLLGAVFTGAGYEVRIAGSGPEAMAVCESESFDALLSDVRMPGMNGHELVRWVVVRHPAIRTVLMSGYDDIACQGCGIAPQPCWLLPKPFHPKDAVSTVTQLLENGTTPLVSIS